MDAQTSGSAVGSTGRKLRVYVSRKLQDIAFVTKMMKEHGLEPKPIPSYYEHPHAWDESPRWRRVFEQYGWGSVMFLSDKVNNKHATLVIEGEISVETGRSSGGALDLSKVVDFYPDLTKHFGVVDGVPKFLTGKIEIPKCLGYHEADATCDGGTNSQGMVEKPCGWRERCIPFRSFTVAAQKVPEDILANRSPEEVITILNKIKAEAPQNTTAPGRPIGAVPLTKPGAKSPQAVGSGAPKSATNKVRSDRPAVVKAIELATGFMELLKESVAPRKLIKAGEAEAGKVEAGNMYWRDRIESSSYVPVFGAVDTGFDVSVCVVRIKSGTLCVQLPMEADHPSLESVREFTTSRKDGRQNSAINGVGSNVEPKVVADLIAQAIKDGVIPLPPVKD